MVFRASGVTPESANQFVAFLFSPSRSGGEIDLFLHPTVEALLGSTARTNRFDREFTIRGLE